MIGRPFQNLAVISAVASVIMAASLADTELQFGHVLESEMNVVEGPTGLQLNPIPFLLASEYTMAAGHYGRIAASMHTQGDKRSASMAAVAAIRLGTSKNALHYAATLACAKGEVGKARRIFNRAKVIAEQEKLATESFNVFEQAAFAAGTRVLAEAIAASEGFSLAGGGDTLAAIDLFDVASGVSYISTGGGAFLEYVEGKELPAVAALRARADHAS